MSIDNDFLFKTRWFTKRIFPSFFHWGLAGLLFLIVACGQRKGVQVRLSENLLPADEAYAPIQTDGVWVFGYDRRLEPKEDVRINASLLEWLEGETGLTFSLSNSHSRDDVVKGLCSGEIHFAIVGTGTYLQANEGCGARILVRGLNSQGEDTYRSAIIVSKSNSLQDLNGLSGHSFAFGALNSTQGHLIPRIMFKRAGLRLAELETYAYTGSHVNTANAVASGRFYAGGLQDTLAQDLDSRGLVKILAFSAPYPSSGIVVGPEVPNETIRLVQQALINLDPTGADAGDLYHWERSEMPLGFVIARDVEYEELRNAAKEFGLTEK